MARGPVVSPGLLPSNLSWPEQTLAGCGAGATKQGRAAGKSRASQFLSLRTWEMRAAGPEKGWGERQGGCSAAPACRYLDMINRELEYRERRAEEQRRLWTDREERRHWDHVRRKLGLRRKIEEVRRGQQREEHRCGGSFTRD